ncbi:MAG TPA: hypothetical protein VFC39_22295 [Acidobacteriaceae bacterium]|nr:hypothetical protein [Acidobacteriaceae bacterium]
MSKPIFTLRKAFPWLLALLLAALPLGAVGAAPQHAGPQNWGQLTLDTYALRGPQDQTAKLYLNAVARDASETSQEQFEKVWVEVSGPKGWPHNTTTYSNVDTSNGQAVIDLGDVSLATVVSVQAEVSSGQPMRRAILQGQTAVTEFAVNSRQVVVPDFEGYGAQMNEDLYTSISNPAKGWNNAPPADTANVEAKVKSVRLGLSRVFLSKNNFLAGNQNLVDSFNQTIELAQAAGARVNITFQSLTHPSNSLTTAQAEVYLDTDMQDFAATVNDLVKNHGITVIKELTVQNEPDSVAYITGNMALYEYAYRQLDFYLKQDRIRNQIKLVGGDLVLNGQTPFFLYMAQHMDDVLDGWSEHIYWNYYDSEYMTSRLDGITAEMATLKSEGYNTKPLSITEYGVRGYKTYNGVALKDEDPYENNTLVATGAGDYVNPDATLTPISQTNIAAFQQAQFNMEGVNDGFIGFSKWDFYRAQYDFGYQDYSLIGYVFDPAPGQDQWPLRPSYYMERLMANTTGQHWQVLGQNGTSGAKLITPFRSPTGDLTLFALSSDGAAASVSVGDLPAGAEFNVLLWNADGSGQVTYGGRVNAGRSGTIAVSIPAGSFAAVTTMENRDHNCGFRFGPCGGWSSRDQGRGNPGHGH